MGMFKVDDDNSKKFDEKRSKNIALCELKALQKEGFILYFKSMNAIVLPLDEKPCCYRHDQVFLK